MTRVTIKEQRWIATSTAQFILEKPDNYEFSAGQYFNVRLPGKKQPGAEPQDITHTFTIASSPRDDELSFVTRMRRSAYKKRLDGIGEGAELEISGPSGEFRLHSARDRTAVLIAGGIGITPFWSIMRTLGGQGKAPRPIVLLYSNRRPQDAAFLRAFEEMEEQRDDFRMIATMTEPDFAEIGWSGDTGRIDQKLLRKAAPQPSAADFYIAGPPGMVDAMNSLVRDSGVPEGQVFAEPFAGYEERAAGD